MNTCQMESKNAELVLPFGAVDRGALPVVGGKGANLGELTRAGLPVPPGFCVTTAAYELVANGASLEQILDDLDASEHISMEQQITVDGAAGTIVTERKSAP